MRQTETAVTVVGMSDDGCVSLTSRAMNAVCKAQVLVGGERHLEFFPQFEGLKIPVKGKLSEILDKVEELSLENNTGCKKWTVAFLVIGIVAMIIAVVLMIGSIFLAISGVFKNGAMNIQFQQINSVNIK